MVRCLLFLTIFLCSGLALAKGDPGARARACVEAMVRGDYAAAQKMFGPTLAKAVDEGVLAKAWKATAGDSAVLGIADVRVEGERVVVRVKLARGTVDVVLGVKDDAVTGLHIGTVENWSAPPYADTTKFDERDVKVGDLPGTLSVPRGAGPFPAVFLVHGSGPNDRDEAMPGGAKLFKDLAWGLASRGVVVLRYEKRTYGHWAALGVAPENVTIKEEYLDDAAAAAKLLRATKEVDPKRIFLAGHSEGAYLTPKLLVADPALAGGIMLSGNARALEDVLVPQISYLFKLRSEPLAEMQLGVLKEQVARVKDPSLSLKTPAASLPLSLPPSYWLSLRGYDAVAVAKGVPQPLLVLQGERDYQVTPEEDFALWKKGLAAKANAKLVLYPKLNHSYFAGEGPITPAEYETKSGHADAKVVEDIAGFVR